MNGLMEFVNRKRALIIALLTAVVAVIAASVLWMTVKSPEQNIKSEVAIEASSAPAVAINTKDADEKTDISPFAGRYVTYEGITGLESTGSAFLVNPKDNDEDIYIEFVVSEDEDVLYSSDLVPSGQGLDVDFSEFLSQGDHDVIITMNPYVLYEGEYLRCPVNNAQSVRVSL